MPVSHAVGRIALAVVVLALASSAALAKSATDTTVSNAPMARFVSQKVGITFAYPSRLKQFDHFPSSYLMPNPRWNHRGPHNAPGHQLVALKLPDSNAASTGILRLGVSDDARARQYCSFSSAEIDRLPGVNTVQHLRIDHVDFQMVTSGGTAGPADISEQSYRAAYNGYCIAIDLVVTGNWASEQKAAFSNDEAFHRLTDLLQGIQFTD